MKPDQERVKGLLSDTVTLLVKNGLNYRKELRIEGLIAVTVDDSEFFVVHINEKFQNEKQKYVESVPLSDSSENELDLTEKTHHHSKHSSNSRKRPYKSHRARQSIQAHRTASNSDTIHQRHTHSPSLSHTEQNSNSTNDLSQSDSHRQSPKDTHEMIPKSELKVEPVEEDVLIIQSEDFQQQLEQLANEPPSKRLATTGDISGFGKGDNSFSGDNLNITGIIPNIYQQGSQDTSWPDVYGSDGGAQPGCSSWPMQPDMIPMSAVYPPLLKGQDSNKRPNNCIWALNVWNEYWRVHRGENETILDITQMTAEQLNKYLTRFVKGIHKSDGSLYPPRSLFEICRGLVQYMRKNGMFDMGIMKQADVRFREFRRALLERLEESEAQGYRISQNTNTLIQRLKKEFNDFVSCGSPGPTAEGQG